jgi:3-phenylpropionate/trans-cinnamate dioxygenase ferredoxin subunit
MYNYQKLDQAKLEFINVCSVEDLGEGGRLFIEIDDLMIVIFNIAGNYYAIADVCSHDDGPVGEGVLEGYEIICPRHGARFDIRNGQVLTLPAFVDIPSYPVRVIDGQVEIGLPSED